jgi:hypothetical protein
VRAETQVDHRRHPELLGDPKDVGQGVANARIDVRGLHDNQRRVWRNATVCRVTSSRNASDVGSVSRFVVRGEHLSASQFSSVRALTYTRTWQGLIPNTVHSFRESRVRDIQARIDNPHDDTGARHAVLLSKRRHTNQWQRVVELGP